MPPGLPGHSAHSESVTQYDCGFACGDWRLETGMTCGCQSISKGYIPIYAFVPQSLVLVSHSTENTNYLHQNLQGFRCRVRDPAIGWAKRYD